MPLLRFQYNAVSSSTTYFSQGVGSRVSVPFSDNLFSPREGLLAGPPILMAILFTAPGVLPKGCWNLTSVPFTSPGPGRLCLPTERRVCLQFTHAELLLFVTFHSEQSPVYNSHNTQFMQATDLIPNIMVLICPLFYPIIPPSSL